MPTCPNGHPSVSDDWCEVCGIRMAGPGMPGTTPPPPPSYGGGGYGFPPPGGDATAQAELCPQCRTPREAMAPFCEECRYNFLTRQATPYNPVAPPLGSPGHPQGPGGHPGGPGHAPGGPHGAPGMNVPPGFPQGQPQRPQDPYEYQGSRPSQVNRGAEPLAPEGVAGQRPPGLHPNAPVLPPLPGFEQPAPPPPHQQQRPPQPAPQQTGGDDWMLPPPGRQGGQQPFAQHPGQPGPHGGPFQGGHPGQGAAFPGQGPAQGGSWSATIGPDRSYFMAMMRRSGPEAAGLNLPAYAPEQHLPLTGGQITIGRRRVTTGEAPSIDLSVPPEDPGVSHQHAVLVQQPDGSWAVVDQNSTNGTTINGGEEPIQPYVPVPLADGDRVHVGAWTTITVRRG
ncbi:FHA domain-containing protein [Streptomyces bambusae]|uniref:FHA domain-containing protein n=1 Tax=Streptomyces bambusae TaxID=1550616 RepID=UPI001CFFC759|nr:FHA domain-containing protein [Streptomyces bambusae]MCB5170303.1 FHA domain-containing protein [Streptomyces bambusae]